MDKYILKLVPEGRESQDLQLQSHKLERSILDIAKSTSSHVFCDLKYSGELGCSSIIHAPPNTAQTSIENRKEKNSSSRYTAAVISGTAKNTASNNKIQPSVRLITEKFILLPV